MSNGTTNGTGGSVQTGGAGATASRAGAAPAAPAVGGGGGQAMPENPGAGGRNAVAAAARSFRGGQQPKANPRTDAPRAEGENLGHDDTGRGVSEDAGQFDPPDAMDGIDTEAGGEGGEGTEAGEGQGAGTDDGTAAFAKAFGLGAMSDKQVDLLADDFASFVLSGGQPADRGRADVEEPEAGEQPAEAKKGFRIEGKTAERFNEYFGEEGPKIAELLNAFSEARDKAGQKPRQQPRQPTREPRQAAAPGPADLLPFTPFFEARTAEGFGEFYDTPEKQVAFLRKAADYQAFKASRGYRITDEQAQLTAHAAITRGRRAAGKSGEQVLNQIRTRSRQVDAAPAGGGGGPRPTDERRSLLGAARSYLNGQRR